MIPHPTKPDLFLERLRLMDASRPHTQKEIAEFCGTTYQHVQQVEWKALRKLRWKLRNELESIRL